jgi:hypothetical protein
MKCFRRNSQLKFYAVPVGAYLIPKRQTQKREIVLREYAENILEIFRRMLSARVISTEPADVATLLFESDNHRFGACEMF